jgi:hypothetical protein
MRNARQILDIVTAVFGQLESEAGTEALAHSNSDYQELGRGWQDLASSYGKSADGENSSELIQSITKASSECTQLDGDTNHYLVASKRPGCSKQHG